MSLVEVSIGMGVMVLGAALYATHSSNVAKNEATMRVKSAMNQISNEATEYLKSREICDRNMAMAFAGINLDGTSAVGNLTHRRLQNKAISVGGTNEYKDILVADQELENGKIWVKDVQYSLSGLQNVTSTDGPWTKSADLKINVTFERCQNGGAVYRKVGGVKTVLCTQIVEQSKQITKQASFKTVSGISTLSACADSQDALIDAAKDYTNKQICLLEAKLMAKTGGTGLTSCGWNVTLIPQPDQVFDATATITLPASAAPGSLVVKLQGGGGGGGGGTANDGGYGGLAGAYNSNVLPDSVLGKSCTITIGAGGGGGTYGGHNGSAGAATGIICDGGYSTSASGGAGGGFGGSSEGSKGGSAPSEWGVGGGYPYCGVGYGGGIGSGGGGGDGRGATCGGHSGGPGGSGRAVLSYSIMQIKDKDGVIVPI